MGAAEAGRRKGSIMVHAKPYEIPEGEQQNRRTR